MNERRGQRSKRKRERMEKNEKNHKAALRTCGSDEERSLIVFWMNGRESRRIYGDEEWSLLDEGR